MWVAMSACCLAQGQPGAPSKPGTGAKAGGKTAPAQKRYCQQGGGFCFSYPGSWTVLGESMGDGVVVAPRQTLARELWEVVTVAAVVPPPAEDQPAMSIDQVIQTAMSNMKASGHDAATLQRQERTVAGLAAQMIRIQYHDEPSDRDWVEELVFIEGPEREIYCIGLKAQAGTMAGLEPAFDGIVRSWKLAPSGSAEPTVPSGKPTTSVPH